ncbi:unnamed protein product [Clavelina lepadiformis]|uniref:Hydantoinase B/oxoprolinase domain-containing protein n=1 Tax=Clavelina lepadiformis TaxID=159417 RepID=A0ABP0FQS5_CLALP
MIIERLDFSCALFGLKDGLVFSAPHIPVHLGAMQDAVQYQMRAIEIKGGDCILSIHPCAGGVHLPDLTMSMIMICLGIHPVLEFMSSCGFEVVQAYLAHIQHHAEIAVGNMLRDVSMTTDGVLHASDKMDDGSMINLRVEIDSQERSVTFHFEGTSPMVTS